MREVSISDIFKYYIKNLSVVIIITLLTLILGIFYVEEKFVPTFQESTTIILGKSNSETKEEISSSTLTLYDSLINNYLELLESKKLMSNIKNDLELDYSIKELSQKINYSVSDNSQLIEISVTDTNDDLAVEICNQIVIELQNQVYEIYGLKNITILDKAKANGNQKYTESFIITIFSALGFLASSCLLIIEFLFSNQLTLQNSIQVTGINYLGKVINYKCRKKNNINLDIDNKVENDFRLLRSNFLEKFEEAKTIMVTSMNKNNNKSFIIYHLVNALIKANKKVIVIDANTKDGLLSEQLIKTEEGIIDLLDNKKELSEVIEKINNIDMIALGNKEKIDLLSSKELDDILSQLKQNYDYIFIETPPYKNNFESISIFKIIDAMLIINTQNQDRISTIQSLIKKSDKKVLGIIFVQVKTKIEKKQKLILCFLKKIKIYKKQLKKEENIASKSSKETNKNNKKTTNYETKSNNKKNSKTNKNQKKQTKKEVGVDKNEKNSI